MKISKRGGIVVVIAGMLCLAIAGAQSLALDPVYVAPHIFTKVLENDHVRVLKVVERNGETSPLHSHPQRVIVYLSPCAWMEESAEGQMTMQSFRLGDVVWLDKATHGGQTSAVVQECSTLEIELKQTQP
jgi:hypothetical protein